MPGFHRREPIARERVRGFVRPPGARDGETALASVVVVASTSRARARGPSVVDARERHDVSRMHREIHRSIHRVATTRERANARAASDGRLSAQPRVRSCIRPFVRSSVRRVEGRRRILERAERTHARHPSTTSIVRAIERNDARARRASRPRVRRDRRHRSRLGARRARSRCRCRRRPRHRGETNRRAR